MDDKRTPMEAEVQEISRPQPREDCFYGTAARPRPQRSYTWFWVSVGLIVIGLSTFGVVAALFKVQIVRRDGDWSLSMKNQEETRAPEETVRDLPVSQDWNAGPVAADPGDRFSLELEAPAGETLTPAQIYAQAAPGVVCVQVQTYYGSGTYTGVVATEDGLVLTATEGLSDALSITLTFSDGRTCSASCLGEDRVTGLGVLKAEAEGLTALRFVSDRELLVGDSAYCVCNPYGPTVPNVFLQGMLSACQTVELGGADYRVLQFSGSGQSLGWGCPILNSRGQVVALTTPIGQRLVSGADPCFGLSVEDLTRIVSNLAESQNQTGHWLGLEVEVIPEEYRFLSGFPGSLWISEVAAGTQPYGVLYHYDVVTAVNGTQVSTVEEYQAILDQCSLNDRVRLTIYRSGKWYSILLPVMER